MNATRVLSAAAFFFFFFAPPLSAQRAGSADPIGPIPVEAQIAFAVQAAPEALRAGATVQGYVDGEFVTLREGTNALICMAPNPESGAFEVSCHHEDLEPFFARGRELRAEGVTGEARVQKRWEEVEAGTLPLPYGASSYVLRGDGFDTATATIENPYLRWVIYTPFATPETTGLSTEFEEGAPWLMFSGTPGSHIMIVPPRGG
ncbi:MAG: hypothetical protein RQ745_00020 [Longimicrobiales bacterium]|nr:hypothetical protein [Longimicrobiales bacterium]